MFIMIYYNIGCDKFASFDDVSCNIMDMCIQQTPNYLCIIDCFNIIGYDEIATKQYLRSLFHNVIINLFQHNLFHQLDYSDQLLFFIHVGTV